ncbi:MAG TPA: bifunctional phosphoglucose/phosphomannose isomerase [Candidatus Acetothermia bacterium]|nr:bifunctional phosphoglucose/phosphomannose isomerase [Candidatus Acetothermia bacterium]
MDPLVRPLSPPLASLFSLFIRWQLHYSNARVDRQSLYPELHLGSHWLYHTNTMDTNEKTLFDKRYDKSHMIDTIDSFNVQCREAIGLGKGFAFSSEEQIDKVVICGMGGSAMAGDVARRFAKVPVMVNRSYTLPSFADSRTLLVAISYSGNTAETISSLRDGIEKGLQALCIASGGKIEQIAQENDIPFLQVPSGFQPRVATGYLALPLIVILSRLDLVARADQWDDMYAALGKVKAECEASVPLHDNPAKELARALHGHIPIIYGTANNTDLVAMRFKTQINENAKQPAYWNAFSELNHNEILALVRSDLLKNQHIVLLKNSYDHPENRIRMEIMTELFDEHHVPHSAVSAQGETELAQILSQIYFGDYVSYYLALANKLDPTPVELIEKFKQTLAERVS